MKSFYIFENLYFVDFFDDCARTRARREAASNTPPRLPQILTPARAPCPWLFAVSNWNPETPHSKQTTAMKLSIKLPEIPTTTAEAQPCFFLPTDMVVGGPSFERVSASTVELGATVFYPSWTALCVSLYIRQLLRVFFIIVRHC